MSTVFVWSFVVGILFVFWIWPILVGRRIMVRKGRSELGGIALGLIFGWIGVLIAMAMGDHTPQRA